MGWVRARSSRSRCQTDRMAGWVISFNFARSSGSAKTSWPKTFRSIDLSGCRMEDPKASTTFFQLAAPGSIRRCAISSVSITCQPRACKPSARVDFPQAMPPVNAISIRLLTWIICCSGGRAVETVTVALCLPSFPNSIWERTCPRNSVAAFRPRQLPSECKVSGCLMSPAATRTTQARLSYPGPPRDNLQAEAKTTTLPRARKRCRLRLRYP